MLLAPVAPPTSQAGVHVAAYELDVRFFPAESRMEGRAVVYIDPTELSSGTVTFYLHGELRAGRVLAAGRPLEISNERVFYAGDYSLVADAVRVDLRDADLEQGLTVEYSGFFHPSRARSPSDYMRIDTDGVFLRAFGYSPWFPLFLGWGEDSHGVSFLHVRLQTPAEFVPVFVGTRLACRTNGGVCVSEWEAECDLLAAQCTARRFRVLQEDGLFVYTAGEDAGTASAVSAFVTELDRGCAQHYGRRTARRQLHVMEMPAFGDIASGNTIGLAEDSWRRFSRTSEAKITLAHELVHDYVVRPIPQDDPLAALVTEGFPSYFHLPVLRSALGAEFLGRFMAATEHAYLARKSGSDPPELALSAIPFERIGEYKDRFVLNDRALLFLDWLRRGMGEDGFDTFTRALFAEESLDRARFLALVEEHLPGSAADVVLWLDCSDYPERFRLPR